MDKSLQCDRRNDVITEYEHRISIAKARELLEEVKRSTYSTICIKIDSKNFLEFSAKLSETEINKRVKKSCTTIKPISHMYNIVSHITGFPVNFPEVLDRKDHQKHHKLQYTKELMPESNLGFISGLITSEISLLETGTTCTIAVSLDNRQKLYADNIIPLDMGIDLDIYVDVRISGFGYRHIELTGVDIMDSNNLSYNYLAAILRNVLLEGIHSINKITSEN